MIPHHSWMDVTSTEEDLGLLVSSCIEYSEAANAMIRQISMLPNAAGRGVNDQPESRIFILSYASYTSPTPLPPQV